MKWRIVRGCLRIAVLAVVGGTLGWLSSSLFGASAQLVKDRMVVVTLGAGIGILFGVVLFPEKELVQSAGKGAGYGNQGNYDRQFSG